MVQLKLISRLNETERIPLNEGDIVHIPAKVLHTHGSIDKKKTILSHCN